MNLRLYFEKTQYIFQKVEVKDVLCIFFCLLSLSMQSESIFKFATLIRRGQEVSSNIQASPRKRSRTRVKEETWISVAERNFHLYEISSPSSLRLIKVMRIRRKKRQITI